MNEEIELIIENEANVVLPEVIAAENERKEAENKRVQQENNRQTAETTRIANETAREQERSEYETKYNNFVNTYNNKPFYFNNVSDMKASTKLKNGDSVITLGYYSANDGGAATYKIRTKTSSDTIDNGSIIGIDTNLVAELIIENDTVNVLQLGFLNNGTNDNSLLFDRLSILKNKIWFFPNGTYNFSNKIEIIDNFKIQLDKNTELKYTGFELIDNFITFKASNDNERYSSIKGGIINGNNNVKNTIHIDGLKNTYYNDIVVKGFKEKAYYLHGTTYKTGDIYIDRNYLINDGKFANTYGIYEDYTTDNKYSNIMMRDCCTAFYIGDARLVECHPWMWSTSLIHGSCMIEVKEGSTGAIATNIFMDTYQFGFKLNKNSNCIINNLRKFENTLFYTPEEYENSPQTIISLGQYAFVKMSNVTGNIKHNIKFIELNGNTLSNRNEFINCTFNYDSGITVTNEPIPVEDKVIYVNGTTSITFNSGDAVLKTRNSSVNYQSSSHDLTNYKLVSSNVVSTGFNTNDFIFYTKMTNTTGTSNSTIIGVSSINGVSTTNTYNINFIGTFIAISKLRNKTY